MKSLLLKTTFSILIASVTAFSMGMQQPARPAVIPPLTTIIQKSPLIKTEFTKVLLLAQKAERVTIYSDMYVFCDKEVYDTLISIAKKAGNKISLHINKSHISNKKVIDLLEPLTNVTLKKSKQHGKRTLIKFKNKGEDFKHRYVFEGSYNPSPNAAKKNAELSLVSYNQRDLYRKHKASHKNGLEKPCNGQEVLVDSPRAQEVCDTTQYDLCASLAHRIHPAQGGTLYMGTMGYNHEQLHNKLIAFLKARGTLHLLVDHTAINSVGQPLLQQLHDAGAHVIVGNMSSTKKNPRGTFHKKYFVRLPDNRTPNLVVIQSANFTKEAHSDFNHASYHPKAAQLGELLLRGHQADVAEGVTFTEFLALKAAKPKRVPMPRAAKQSIKKA